MTTSFTPRQELVLKRLYVESGWSVPMIQRALGLGRRRIENALRRVGVTVTHGKREGHALRAVVLATAVLWFAEAERPFEDPAPPTRTFTGVGGELTLTFRDRRCQVCGALSHYLTTCPACNTPLDAPTPDLDPTVAALLREETTR